LINSKQQSANENPELFAIYSSLASESREVLTSHVAHLIYDLTQIIQKGVADGIFQSTDSRQTAWAIFTATSRFHHPTFVQEWKHPEIDTLFHAIWELILNGLSSKAY
jgi:hypothetical protein